MIDENQDAWRHTIKINVEKHLGSGFEYLSVMETLSNIDESKIKTNKQFIKKVSSIEQQTYEVVNKTLATIIDTMNNVDW
jgi:hypothetical protein